jgi:hypothetical protein
MQSEVPKVVSILLDKGIIISPDWCSQAIDYLQRQGPLPTSDIIVADKIFSLFLDCDIYEMTASCNTGILPNNMINKHKEYISPNKPIILQVNIYLFFYIF